MNEACGAGGETCTNMHKLHYLRSDELAAKFKNEDTLPYE